MNLKKPQMNKPLYLLKEMKIYQIYNQVKNAQKKTREHQEEKGTTIYLPQFSNDPQIHEWSKWDWAETPQTLPEDKQFVREHLPQGQEGSWVLTAGRDQAVTQGCQFCGLLHEVKVNNPSRTDRNTVL